MPRCYVGFVRVFALVCGVCMCLREVPYRFLMYPYVPYSVHRSFLNHPIRPIPLCVQRSFRHLGLGHKILETRTLWWTMWRCDDVTMWLVWRCVQTKGCAKLVHPTQPSPCPNSMDLWSVSNLIQNDPNVISKMSVCVWVWQFWAPPFFVQDGD